MTDAPFSPSEYRARIAQAQAVLRQQGLGACVCIAPELLYYFAGYDGHTHFSDQALIIGAEDAEPTFIYRDVDAGLAAESCWLADQRTYHYGEQDPFALIATACAERVGAKGHIGVCFDTHALKGNKALRLSAALSEATVTDASRAIESIRLVKSDQELAYVREAGRFADAGLQRAREAAAAGMSEIELAGHIETAMRQLGGEYPAMPAWVSGGERTRGAHKTPRGRRLTSGDRIKLEFTGVHQRYHAVTMQTIWLDHAPSEEVQDIYAVAADALRAGEAAIHVGAPVAASEAAAFAVLEDHGFDLRWHSRFGYGVGIAYPPTWLESLDITRESDQVYAANHSFTLHVALKDPVENLGLMLGGAYVLTDAGLECLSGGALELTVV